MFTIAITKKIPMQSLKIELLPISSHNYDLINENFSFSAYNVGVFFVSFFFFLKPTECFISYLISLITEVTSPEFCSIIHLAIKIQ